MNRENLGELFAAMAAARQEFGKLTKDKSASIKSEKGSYGYTYADLSDVIEATAAAMAKHGLVVIQEPEVVSDGGRQVVVIHGCIAHKSGGVYALRPLPLPVAGGTAQAIGSAISYGRRYQLTAMLNLAAADDDGDEASNGTEAKPQRQNASKTPQKAQETQEDKKTPDTATHRLTPEQAAIIAHLGKSAYGDEWDDNMDKLAQWSSGGAREKLGNLYEIEAEKLIKALKKKVEQSADEKKVA